uniref:GDNF domain-containing protein n=1 Tax=Strongyloides venezuelensis TaxID=75913 RepID=A0A0K0EWR0_STRVS
MYYDLINKDILPLTDPNLSIYTKNQIVKIRKKRSPTNHEIQELKIQLNNELRRINSLSKPIQPQVSCDYALNQICLRHIACHELWNIFRRSCIVDSQNNCRMTSLAHCWQSYEGISWTGLGNCTCYDKNSDCHWIRLQTNYNKCISEIHSRSMSNVIHDAKPFTTIPPNILYSATSAPLTTSMKRLNDHLKKTNMPFNTTKYLETKKHSSDHFYNYNNREQTLSLTTPTKMPLQQPLYDYETFKYSPTSIKSIYNKTDYYDRKHSNKTTNDYKNSTNQNIISANKESQILPPIDRNFSKDYRLNNSALINEKKLLLKNFQSSNYTFDNKKNVFKNDYLKSNIKQTQINKNGLTNIRINGQLFIPPKHQNPINLKISPKDEKKKVTDSVYDSKNYQLYNKINGTPSYDHAQSTTKSIYRNLTKVLNQTINLSLNDDSKILGYNNISQSLIKNKQHQSLNITEKQIIKDSYFKNIENEDLNKTSYLKKTPILSVSENIKNMKYKSSSNGMDNVEKMNLKEMNVFNKKNNGINVDYNNITTLLKSRPAKLSSCQEAFQLCSQDENCQWLFSSIQMKCKSEDGNGENNCNRQQCAKAIKNLATSPQRSIVEAMMFCQCAPNDKECETLQQWMYPPCLYGGSIPNCKEVISSCLKDRSCKHLSKSYFHSCAVSNGSCKPGTYQMNGCRQAVIKLRGSVIDTLCHCEDGDNKCWSHRIELIPLNPCLQKAKDDYAMKGLMPTKPSIIPHDIQLPLKQKNKVINETEKINLSGIINSSASVSGSKKVDENKNLIEKINISSKNISNSLNITNKEDMKKIMYDNFTIPTDEYQTQEPPSTELGCRLRNFNGDWVEVFKGTIFRQYTDWYGRCSNWCECLGNNTQICKELPCLEDDVCIHGSNIMNFGEKLYIEGRGACTCHMGNFICDTPRELDINFQPGLYILAGFSKQELQMFKENVPLEILEKSGLVSDDKMLAKDIASRLQYSLERIMPTGTMCRIIIIEEYLKDEIVILRLQWYGMNIYNKNDTEYGWHVGSLEKVCSPYVKQVARNFLLNMAERYQLVLSSVKQIRVVDLLNELPSVSSGTFLLKNYNVIIIFYFPLISTLIKIYFII